mmetsp:Transcript_53110/g.154541  ORF Transcript_53110/g.154541 Transcript_53110/m.154541 type:complete len:263 (-) Transcript_53110:113-901(-)
MPETEPTRSNRPRPAAIMSRANKRQSWADPLTFTASMLCRLSTGCCTASPLHAKPAQLTRSAASTFMATTASCSWLGPSGVARSTTKTSALPAGSASRISRASSSRGSLRRPLSTTPKPRLAQARARAAPTPEDAPVTTAQVSLGVGRGARLGEELLATARYPSAAAAAAPAAIAESRRLGLDSTPSPPLPMLAHVTRRLHSCRLARCAGERLEQARLANTATATAAEDATCATHLGCRGTDCARRRLESGRTRRQLSDARV